MKFPAMLCSRVMRRVACSLAIACFSLAGFASAADGNPEGSEEGASSPKKKGADAPFVHVTDPSTDAAGSVSVGYGVGNASAGAAERPIPVAPTAGIVHTATASYGITGHFAPFVSMLFRPGTTDVERAATAQFGLKAQLTDPAGPFRLTVIGTAFRELDHALGGSLRIAASYDIGKLRLASNLHGERVFATGRDGLDVMVLAGASYQVIPMLRLGAEYVGQDLEEIGESAAEGGAKHYAGPTAALDLGGPSGRVQLTFGPTFALTKTNNASVLARAALSVAF